jgi:PAP2 superfamily/Secretion system C-terminal sorting domain
MKTSLLFLSILIGISVANAQTAFDENANVPHKYYELSLKLIKETPGFTPPVASRALGYTGLCLYESVVHGMPNFQSLVGDLPDFNAMPQPENAPYSWSVVANNALAFLLDSLYDNKTLDNKVLLYAARTDLNTALQAQLPADVFARSVQFGEAVGLSIFEYSKTESGYRGQYKNFPASYVPPSGNEFWAPLPNQVALQPYWGNNRAFMPENVTAGTLPPAPPSFSDDPSSVFYAYANQVYTTGQNLTQDQKDIASFWADGGGTFTPPGHSISMLRQILRQENWDLGHSAQAYAKLGLSLSDAFLACWKTKYIYNLCRPVTYIRANIDPNWSSFIGTPPFPEYPSGHSSQSGAWSVIMNHLFGDNYAFNDSTYAATLGVRAFTDFESCAEETAVSRLYGGIHYDFGNQNGSYLGQTIGENIINLFQQVSSSSSRPLGLQALKLFPNPTSGQVFVKNASANMAFVKVFSLTGQLAKQGSLQGSAIDLTGLASGLFIVTILDKNGLPIGQQKLVIE